MTRFRIALLIVLLGVFAAASFTLEEQSRETGYGREARLNPWLAAGQLLERRGVPVRFAPAYARLPASARVLVLATPLPYLDAAEQRELLAWVKQGGHLVVQAPPATAANDLVLRPLHVWMVQRDFDKAEREALAREPRLRPTELQGDGVLQTRFRADHALRHGRVAPAWEVTDAHGSHALRFAVGAGRVTALSDLDWMDNRRLGDGDHAGLLWRVVDAGRGEETWLVHGTERPSLLALAWESAAPFLLALALCVATWVWAASRRFGPLLERESAPRRALTEHLQASGRHLLRHGGAGALVASSRERLLAQVQRRHPQWRQLPTAELAHHLADRAGLESGAVRRLLEADAPADTLQFAADIRLINRLRKAL